MEIYVLRHGITKLNKLGIPNGQIDEPLAPEGFEQAKQATTVIPSTVTHIYVSPLLRARQTAEVVNSDKKLALIVHEGITEVNMGSVAGSAWESIEGGLELRRRHRALEYDYRPYGGDSVEDAKERILTFLKEIKDKHQSGEVLLITHGGIVRLLTLLEQDKALEETKNLSLYTFNLDKIWQ